MFQKLKTDCRGFTLTELVISSTLGIMIIGVVLFCGVHMQRNLEMSSARMTILSDLRVVSDWLAKDIKSAGQVEVSGTLLGQFYSTGTSQLVLRIPTVDASGDVVDATYDYIAYAISGTSLFRIYDADVASRREDQTKIISQNVSNLRLSSDGVLLSSVADVTALEKLTVGVGFLTTALNQDITDSVESTIRLRNKIT